MRGGKRPGAGRPKGSTGKGKINLTVRIKPDLLAQVKQEEHKFKSRSELVEEAIKVFLTKK